MASWMVHLRVADKLFEQIENLDEQAFIMGNIAPDSGVPNEDWTVFSRQKTFPTLVKSRRIRISI